MVEGYGLTEVVINVVETTVYAVGNQSTREVAGWLVGVRVSRAG